MPLLRLILVLVLVFNLSVLGAAPVPPNKAPTKKAPAAAKAPAKPQPAGMTPQPAGMTPQQKDARRAALAKIIAIQQETIDSYNRQNSFEAKQQISSAQYEQAKATRDRAQAERDDLTR